jgi:N-acetylneuraminic acid mutarotase
MGKRAALLLVLALLTTSYIIITKPVKASGDLWVTRAPMPQKHGGFGTTSANGAVFAINLNFTYMFDPSSDSWASKTPMPTHQSGFAIATCQNKIYVIGGWNSTDPNTGLAILTGANEMYDPATDSWRAKAPMPVPTAHMQANVVDGKVYVISGFLGTISGPTGAPEPNISDATWVYDPSTDSWSTAAPIPTPVWYYASAVVDNEIYVEGGETATSPHYTGLNQIYDPETNTWTLGEPLPVSVHKAGAGATTGVLAPPRLYVMGGTNDGYNGVNTTQIYDPQTNSWVFGAFMPTSRLELEVAVLNDTLYAMGGASWVGPEANIGTVYATNEQYIPLDYQGSIPSPYVPTPSPSPATSPSPTPLPSETPAPSTTPSPSAQPTKTPEPQQEPFPTALVATASGLSVAIISIALLVYFKKRKH